VKVLSLTRRGFTLGGNDLLKEILYIQRWARTPIEKREKNVSNEARGGERGVDNRTASLRIPQGLCSEKAGG